MSEDNRTKATVDAIKNLATDDFKYHSKSCQDVLAELKVDFNKGLSDSEAEKRLEQYGPNELDEEEEESLWEKIKEQFEDLLARILLVAATISFAIAMTGDGSEGIAAYVEPFVILLILILNAMVAIYQDGDAASALDALKNMQSISCQVRRNGNWVTLESQALVPGDIVQVRMGDNVPADVRLVELNSASLQVEEAALTGEPESIVKTTDQVSGNVLQDQRNMIFSSTIVTYGQATGVVVFTGMKTAIGRVQQQVSEAAEEEEDTPLKQMLDDFGEKLSYVIMAICFIVWIMNYANFSDPIHGGWIKGCIYYFKIAIALAVAAIPEGLPAVITTCLALGTRKMARNNCIVRKLNSVETLGCTTVICSDKTGTLTKNEMCAVAFALIDGTPENLVTYNIKEQKEQGRSCYDPLGLKYDAESEQKKNNRANRSQLIEQLSIGCIFNNTSRIDVDKSTKSFSKVGEPTEASLKILAEKLMGNPTSIDSVFAYEKKQSTQIKEVAKLDFTSKRKTMSTIVTGYRNEKDLLLKGAPDRILNKCNSYMRLTEDGKNTTWKFTAQEKIHLQDQIDQLSAQGLRCLAIAEIPTAGKLYDITKENQATKLADNSKYDDFEQDATFVGIVCIKDPIRPEVGSAIADCQTAGIRVIMITGDSKNTASCIAKEAGILTNDQNVATSVFTGTEFEKMTKAQKQQAIGGTGGKVFARVEPAHKRELVKELKEAGQVVAMTGDGVNDAPALKQAHIGIAMGITGTEVAKSAADMVLADDNFATIVKAVKEGRAIYSNMKAFIRYLISSNIGEVLSIFFTALLGIPEGFNSVQLLWVNLVTDGPPATALGFNPPDFDIMTRPPRGQNDALLSRWTLIRYFVIGTYVGLATVGIFIYWYIFAVTGDGHTLVSWQQLSHWGECPTWSKEDFAPVNFVEGLDLQADPCKYFTDGKVKASTLSLSVLVIIEMLNALNAISEDNSLLTASPFVNIYLLIAIGWAIGLHIMIVYVPFMAKIFSIYAMNTQEWILVFAFSSPVILVDEILKIFGRAMNATELRQRMSKKKVQ